MGTKEFEIDRYVRNAATLRVCQQVLESESIPLSAKTALKKRIQMNMSPDYLIHRHAVKILLRWS